VPGFALCDFSLDKVEREPPRARLKRKQNELLKLKIPQTAVVQSASAQADLQLGKSKTEHASQELARKKKEEYRNQLMRRGQAQEDLEEKFKSIDVKLLSPKSPGTQPARSKEMGQELLAKDDFSRRTANISLDSVFMSGPPRA